MSASQDNNRVAVSKTWKHYVGGAFVRSESGRVLRQTDREGNFVANVAFASRKDLRDAVVAARKAQPGWAGRSAFNRSQILFRIAEMLEARRASFEQLLREHAGLSAEEAAAELSCAADRAFWYAGWADKHTQVLGNVNPVAAPYFNFSLPEPMGVVALFPSTTSPLVGLISAIMPALVGGNAVIAILDGPARTIGLELGEVLATSDVPGGVVNLLSGTRADTAPHAAAHRDIDALAIWGGEREDNAELQRAAAESVKRVRLSADPDAAAWRDPSMQSLWRIDEFVEIKTAWHPIGV